MVGRDLLLYLAETEKYRRRHPGALSLRGVLRAYRPWRRALSGSATSLQAQTPWMTFAAIERLERILTPEALVFEYGAGGSTLFFARRARQVFSVEHDPDWWTATTRALAELDCGNAEVRLVEPEQGRATPRGDPSDPGAYLSSDARFASCSWQTYAGVIDPFPPGHFDVVVIDGRARPSCFRHAVPKVRPGGYLVLDNAEREHYAAIHAEMERAGWQKWSDDGPGPFIPYFWQTAFWRRPAGEVPA